MLEVGTAVTYIHNRNSIGFIEGPVYNIRTIRGNKTKKWNGMYYIFSYSFISKSWRRIASDKKYIREA